jgi:hypothetical protein
LGLNREKNVYSRDANPFLSQSQAGEKFSKGVPKDNFRILFIIGLKTKGGLKEKFSIFSFEQIFKAGDMDSIVKLETWHP